MKYRFCEEKNCAIMWVGFTYFKTFIIIGEKIEFGDYIEVFCSFNTSIKFNNHDLLITIHILFNYSVTTHRKRVKATSSILASFKYKHILRIDLF